MNPQHLCRIGQDVEHAVDDFLVFPVADGQRDNSFGP